MNDLDFDYIIIGAGTAGCLLANRLSADPDKRVLSQGLVELAVSQGYKGDWSGLFAGLVMAMLPVLAAYIIFQRQVVAGLTAGALK